MTAPVDEPTPVDPFDLPEDLGTGEVTWSADDGVGVGHLVHGRLHTAGSELACDLLAVDQAYPAPVVADVVRARVHQAWRHGEVHLVSVDDRLTLLVPGTRFDADLVLTALGRLVKALGASPDDFVVQLRLG